ncbi:uncharacterized protein STEHIDRAFT_154370 [Stereum hirsutum FP-91666 SS1]|uniref:uncharacterized protein n=1 Tax=Stereum hirsutum (strain FP-91666) TaxID=721885 RepID=UPI000440CBE1|nr:uncharacterized protein STEHIDRAFT_154370 [Stereum hirsutum FP-91666 SS1]EIM88643.1 hypothetical protein STEHIDRAFT_154370 [Stereum hirsutum FP-91666 SS1]
MGQIALIDLLALRLRLFGNVIRRTLFSKDFMGVLLSGMEMYLELPLKTRPYPHEAVILENTA